MAKINTAAEFEALRDCAAAVIKAGDGRGVRGARVACRNALVRAGRTPVDAQTMAEAQSRWAARWWSEAGRLVATYQAGAAT